MMIECMSWPVKDGRLKTAWRWFDNMINVRGSLFAFMLILIMTDSESIVSIQRPSILSRALTEIRGTSCRSFDQDSKPQTIRRGN